MRQDQLVEQSRAFRVDVQEAAEIGHVILVGGEVKYKVDAFQRRQQVGRILHLSLPEVHVGRHVFRLSPRMHARLQRVKHAHIVALGQQQVHRVRADETRSAGNQDPSLHTLSMRRRVYASGCMLVSRSLFQSSLT